MDPVSLAIGAMIFAAGYGIGLLTRRRGHSDAPQVICGCGHGLDQHDPKTWACHAETPRDEIEGGTFTRRTFVPCTCRQYTGAKPVEEMFAPKYLPPSD